MYIASPQVAPDGIRWEGYSLSVYADSKKLPTQGIGQHDGVNFGDPDIDDATAWQWFTISWQRAYFGAKTLVPELDSIDVVRKEALIWLVYNMGQSKLAQFAPFLSHVNRGEWDEAAFHVLTNLSGHITPYVLQVGARAEETALRICSGNVLAEFRV